MGKSTETTPHGPTPPAPVWRLRVVFSPDSTRADTDMRIGRLGAVLGREPPSAATAIGDPRMSRSHAALRISAGRLRVTDEDSKNGVFVNGWRVREATLDAGDVLRLGDSLFVVRDGPAPEDGDDLGFVGVSPAIAELRDTLRTVAPSRLSVLVAGPSGAGKELVARALHDRSRRRGPFVALNCAALPDTLVEDAFFGHVKGAFTHAATSEIGAFRRADGGTLFLDEIGEMALAAQPKLLRTLDSGEVATLGASAPVRVDVRVVAATNRPLAAAMAEGRFRGDLFARLAGIVIDVPPLVERPEDVLPLFAAHSPSPRALSADAAEALLVYSWPLNVREVRQLASRLAVTRPGSERIEVSHLDEALRRPIVERQGAAEPVATGAPTKDELMALLERFGGSVADVAAEVGRTRRQVYRWMDQRDVPRGTGRR